MLNPLKLVQSLLLKVRKKESYKELQQTLLLYPSENLLLALDSQNKKLAFWINAYNAYYQIVVRENPSLPDNRNALYKQRHFAISNNELSLDQVEHGILRRRKFKYSLGYLPSLFDTDFVKQHQAEKLDFRIHFALNCGAKSCPSIAFYTAENIEQELEMATQSFLEQESDFDETINTVHVSKILFWYLGDFGGKAGIRKLLKKYQIIPQTARPKIKFKDYNWELDLENYSGF
ncbi:MAG: hypothetical protein ACJAWV_001553 [Flammeovirgaceae bacterium]|jgi:hypothetical protein